MPAWAAAVVGWQPRLIRSTIAAVSSPSFCSSLLADLGADVVVIANPGDPFGVGIPTLGRNKRSMTLNLKSDKGKAILFKLMASADVLIQNFRPGVVERMGIQAINALTDGSALGDAVADLLGLTRA